MTQYNTLNVKLSNSQLNKLKSETNNGTDVTLNLSSLVIGNFNDESNFPHKLSLTNQCMRVTFLLSEISYVKRKKYKTFKKFEFLSPVVQ